MYVTSKLKFNKTYEKNNARLLQATRRGNVGEVSVIQPMNYPFTVPMVRPLRGSIRRKIGETTVDRIRYGSPDFWTGTPLEVVAAKSPSVGNPEILFDLRDSFDDIGFSWNYTENVLDIFLTKDDKTIRIKFPVKKIAEIFNKERAKCGGCSGCSTKVGAPDFLLSAINQMGSMAQTAVDNRRDKADSLYRETGFKRMPDPVEKNTRSQDKEAIKKAGGCPVPKTAKEKEAANVMFKVQSGMIRRQKRSGMVCNPSGKIVEIDGRDCNGFFKSIRCKVDNITPEWFDNGVREVGKVAKKIGEGIMEVIKSPVFAGIMSVVSFIPPLNAVGGLGLAASVASNVVKPIAAAVDSVSGVVDAAKSVASVVKGVKSAVDGGGGKAVQEIAGLIKTNKTVAAKANGIVNGFTGNMRGLPPGARKLMKSALQATPYNAPRAMPIFKATIRPGQQTKASVSIKKANAFANNFGFRFA